MQLDPVYTNNNDFGAQKNQSSASDLMAGNNRKSRAQQHRSSDGKFQSDFGGGKGTSQVQATVGRKGTNFGAQLGDMGTAPMRGETGGGAGRKGRTSNKRGGGGTVANHFYDA